MHPHVTDVFAQLSEARSQLRAALDAVPPGERGRRPGEGRWSANEVLEHLSLVERRFAGLIGMRIAEARAAGLAAEAGTRDPFPPALQQTLGDRANRRTAPDAVQPKGGLANEDAWAAVEAAREVTIDTVSAADGLALSSVKHQHPVFGTLDAYQLVELIARHEVRHSKQIAGIAEELT